MATTTCLRYDYLFQSTGSLFYFVGLGGYLYALDDTRDNILLNFPMNDSAVMLGRTGFCLTLLFGLPLVTLPCREAFLAVPVQIQNWKVNSSLATQFDEVDQQRRAGAHLVINGVDFDELDPVLVTSNPDKLHVTMLTYGTSDKLERIICYQDGDSVTTSGAGSSDTTQVSDKPLLVDDHPLSHVMSTFLVVGVCYIFAITVPGVGFVWSLAGSSMAILIAFVVPTSCYLRIRRHKRMNPRAISAWCLLLVSSIISPICTQQALRNGFPRHP